MLARNPMALPATEIVATERRMVIPSFDFRVELSACTARGTRHKTNQDAVLCRPELGLFAVADGLGGHAAGEVAARVALATIASELAKAEAQRVVRRYARDPSPTLRGALFSLLRSAVGAANFAVRAEGEASPEQRGLGTTLDLVLLVRDRAFVAHVGDSRVYLARGTTTIQLTSDHTSHDGVRSSARRVGSSVARAPLIRSVGHAAMLVPDTLTVDLASEDRLLLCTDGAFAAVGEEPAIGEAIRATEGERAALSLLGAARAADATDDGSVVAIAVGERFVSRSTDRAPRTRDLEIVQACPLFVDLGTAAILTALSAAVELELEPGAMLVPDAGGDRFAYVVLDGLVALAGGRTMGPSALLCPESLVDVVGRNEPPRIVEHARLLRIRQGDIKRLCEHDPALVAGLYERLARHLAQLR